MAPIGLDQLRMNRPQVNRAMIDATTEADIRRHTSRTEAIRTRVIILSVGQT